MSRCRKCGEVLLWTRTARGSRIPLDFAGDPAGTLTVERLDTGELIARPIPTAAPSEGEPASNSPEDLGAVAPPSIRFTMKRYRAHACPRRLP